MAHLTPDHRNRIGHRLWLSSATSRSGSPRGRAWPTAGAFLACLILLAAGCTTPDLDNVRILTYNTALLYAAVEHPSPVPPPSLLVTACVQCDPFGVPPVSVTGTLFCECWPTATLQPNLNRYGNLTEVQRAQKIAERIRVTDQDIVVLNEAFNPDAKAVFVQTLANNGPYKHYVSLLRGHAIEEGLTLGDLIVMQAGDLGPILDLIIGDLPEFLDYHAVSADSGLMLFSKYPFLPLEGDDVLNDAGCGDPECQYQGLNNGIPLTPAFFSFKVFDHCQAEDCWASKGVGLVKVDTPPHPSYVAFTHMQADYADDGVFAAPTRELQLGTIRDVIVGAIPQVEIADAAVHLAGDTNVSGYNRTKAQNLSTQEWHDIFNPDSINPNVADGFFSCGNGIDTGPTTDTCRFGINGSHHLTDSWGFETSPTDPGISGLGDGTRLDYIMHSSMGGRMCMQHSMIAWDLQADIDGSGGATWLSDHYPVRGDFGLSDDWCSPNDDADAALPYRNVHLFQFGPTDCTDTGAGNNPTCHTDEEVFPPDAVLVSGGGFQWFRIDQAGTYSFDLDPAVPGENVDYVIYHHTDLSRPIQPFDDEPGEFGIIYSMPQPPYYIRTFAVDGNGKPDRTAKGRGYYLHVHQHLCRSPQDACALDPGLAVEAPYFYKWPNTVGGNPGDPLTELRELWWMFKTSGVKGGHLVGPGDPDALFPKVRMQMEAPAGDPYTCLTDVAPHVEVYDDHLFPTQLVDTIPFVATDVDPDDHDWDDDGFRDDMRIAPDLKGEQFDEFKYYFLKVTRDSSFLDPFSPCNASMTTYVSYHTDLTYIVPQKVQVWTALDFFEGEDDMLIHMGFDDTGWTQNPSPFLSLYKAFTPPDTGSLTVTVSGNDILHGYYVNSVWPTFWETDFSQRLDVWDPYPPPFAGIASLSSWILSVPAKPTDANPFPDAPFVQYSNDGNANDADYYYYLWYKVCHLETEPVCSNP